MKQYGTGSAGVRRQKAAEKASGIGEPDEGRTHRLPRDSEELITMIHGVIGSTVKEHMAYGEKKAGIKITKTKK